MNKTWLVVLAIILTAAVFRLQHIKSIPPGLYPDEAMNGNNAIQALELRQFKVFYPENNGREGLFINLQALSLKIFGYEPWALRLVSAIVGILTVWGTYFLAKELFNWQIGAISSFLLATSFWHTMFSRIGFRAIMAPFFLVWGFYFFWRGLSRAKFWSFAVSGVFWGLGFYTYIAYRIMPLSVLLVVFSYWQAIKKDFSAKKYLETRNLIARGLALFLLTTIIVALPIGYYFYTHPNDFFGRTGQLSILNSQRPLQSFAVNIVKTLGIFNFVGDYNWRHNFAGEPLLFWPVGILFVFGFLKSCVKLFRHWRKHGHLSSVQVLLLSWFLIGLLPVAFSNEGIPHALRAILVTPVVFIFAAEGLWWLYDFIKDWYQDKDPHVVNIYRKDFGEGSFVAGLVVAIILVVSMVAEYDKYFFRWALNSNVPPAFAQNYVELGNRLNGLPRDVKKYVLVNMGGVLVNGIPMPAQTVMFITDTLTSEKQKAKNIYYLTEDEYTGKRLAKGSLLIPLEKTKLK